MVLTRSGWRRGWSSAETNLLRDEGGRAGRNVTSEINRVHMSLRVFSAALALVPVWRRRRTIRGKYSAGNILKTLRYGESFDLSY